jgi:hypothetical protein
LADHPAVSFFTGQVPLVKGEGATPEAAAKTSLALIEQLIQDGKTEVAKWRLERFIEKYKGTKSEKQARTLLDSVK